MYYVLVRGTSSSTSSYDNTFHKRSISMYITGNVGPKRNK